MTPAANISSNATVETSTTRNAMRRRPGNFPRILSYYCVRKNCQPRGSHNSWSPVVGQIQGPPRKYQLQASRHLLRKRSLLCRWRKTRSSNQGKKFPRLSQHSKHVHCDHRCHLWWSCKSHSEDYEPGPRGILQFAISLVQSGHMFLFASIKHLKVWQVGYRVGIS